MPTPEGYGVTPEGFLAPNVAESAELFASDFQGIWGAGIDVGPKSNFGQLAGVVGERYADCFAMGQDTYNSGTPDGAAGAALDFLNGLVGVIRIGAEPSLVLETLTGLPSTPLPIFQIVAVTGIGTQFQTKVTAELPPAVPAVWASSTPYAQGAVVGVTDAQGTHLYLAIVGGTSGTTSAPSGYGPTIIDKTVTWSYAGEAVADWAIGDAYTAAVSASGQGGQRVTIGNEVFQCVTAGPGNSYQPPNGTPAAPPAWVTGAYAVGDIVQGVGAVAICSVAGGGNSVDAPTGAPGGHQIYGDGYTWYFLPQADGYIWQLLGQGTVAIDVPCESVLEGPLPAGIGSLTTIVTPVAGWSSCYNLLAASLGQNVEQDDGGIPGPGYRLRREQEIRTGGSGYLQAIQTAVLDALIAINPDNAESSIQAYENITDAYDGQNRPPHSFEIIVLPFSGVNPQTQFAIASAIFQNKPAGIQPVGQCTGGSAGINQGAACVNGPGGGVVVIDSKGHPWTIFFSIPVGVPVFVGGNAGVGSQFIVDIDPAIIAEAAPYPNTIAAVAAILSAFGSARPAGKSMTCSSLIAATFGLAGVLDVTELEIGTTDAFGTSDVLAMTPYQFAEISVGDVFCTVEIGSP